MDQQVVPTISRPKTILPFGLDKAVKPVYAIHPDLVDLLISLA